MKAYLIDNNGFYLGETDCQPSPLEPGIFLIPGGAIDTPPLKPSKNKVPKWDGTKWVEVFCYLGSYWHKQNRKEKTFELGEEFDDNYTNIKPLENVEFQDFINGQWIKNEEKELAHKNAIAKQNREQAYRVESDPIYFLWQRGEATEQDWKNKIAEIKQRYPYE